MPPRYPKDSDGDSLRQLAADGNDMSAPMSIDFPVSVPAEIPAKKIASLASAQGYQVQLYKDEFMEDWDVICTITMVPDYDAVVRVQKELSALAKPFHGYCDSWGTFGNKGPGAPPAG